MEYLITFLPTIFCLFTGILIAWSIQLGLMTSSIIHSVKQHRSHARLTEIIQVGVLSFASIFLFVLLFVAFDFASFHMSTIIICEIWYALYLYCSTKNLIQSEYRLQHNDSLTVINQH